MLDSIHKSADVIIYKLFHTGYMVSILDYATMFPAFVLHTTHQIFSGFVQCEIELDQKENKLKGHHMNKTGMLKKKKKHITCISQMYFAASQTQTSAQHWWYKSSKLFSLSFILFP